jgi:uncharacterized protein (DUF58 family)
MTTSVNSVAEPQSLSAKGGSRVGHWAVSREFCPWADPLVAALKTPLGLLTVAFVVAVLLAVAVGSGGLWAAGTILAVIVIGTLWPTLTVRGIRGQLGFGRRRVCEGELVRVSLSLTNRWPWPAWGLTCRGGLPGSAAAACGSLPAAGTAAFDWSFTPARRGRYPQGTPLLATAFPFGIRNASRPIDAGKTSPGRGKNPRWPHGMDAAAPLLHSELIVWPRTVPLTSLLDVAETRPSDERFTDARCGDAGDVLGTRPFQNGDSLRRIHWPQTARTGALVVCERQAPASSAVRIVFDSDPALHEPLAGDSSLDWSIRIAASIAVAYHRERAAVECCFGHETLVLNQGTAGLTRFLDQLASFEPCPAGHPADCQHEHDEHHCHRIHHRHCGIFQVTITTLRGLQLRTEHRHVHGDQLWVVLTPAEQQQQRRPGGRGRTLWVQDASDPLIAFQHAWERLCHVG